MTVTPHPGPLLPRPTTGNRHPLDAAQGPFDAHHQVPRMRPMISQTGHAAAISTAPADAGRPDSILVREARGGDAGAYGELVRRYQDRVYTFIYGLVQNHDDALDLSQDVFVRAHRSLNQF